MISDRKISLVECEEKLDINKDSFIDYTNTLRYLGYNDSQIEAFIFSNYNPLDIVGYKLEDKVGYQLTLCGETMVRNDYHEAREEYLVSELILLSRVEQTIPSTIIEKIKEKKSIEELIESEKSALKIMLLDYKKDVLLNALNRELKSFGLLDKENMELSIQSGMEDLEYLNTKTIKSNK